MTSYYNEIDPAAAAMLRSLIAAGQIAPGIVDERSIEDVRPDELAGYAQCHFFAGYGIWSLALRQAGIPDDYRVWSMSCPCQPFSAAGKGEGFADIRHLWPAAYHLISQCRPERIVGEQVASKDTDPWIDLVQVDLEALGYAFGCVPFPSSCVGAPHIRDRAYWVANPKSHRNDGPIRDHKRQKIFEVVGGGESDKLGHTTGNGREVRRDIHGELSRQGLAEGRESGGVGYSICSGRQPESYVPGSDGSGMGSPWVFTKQLSKTVSHAGWVADTHSSRSESCGTAISRHTFSSGRKDANWPIGIGEPCCMADTEHHEHQGCISGHQLDSSTEGRGQAAKFAGHSSAIGVDDSQSQRRGFCNTNDIRQANAPINTLDDASRGAIDGCRPDDWTARPGPVNGHWSDADWLFCRDGKWRPVEPGTFPLAHGMPRSMGAMPSELRGLAELAGLSGDSLKRAKQYRVQQLKGYGNAINAQAATVFIEAVVGNQGAGVKA